MLKFSRLQRTIVTTRPTTTGILSSRVYVYILQQKYTIIFRKILFNNIPTSDFNNFFDNSKFGITMKRVE